MTNNEIEPLVSELQTAMQVVLYRHNNDPKAAFLLKTLTSQLDTVKNHFTLMSLERESMFVLSAKEFNEIMVPYLRLNREIRRSVNKSPNSLYETEPINGFYELLSRHFKEDGEE